MISLRPTIAFTFLFALPGFSSSQDYVLPRCEVIPLANHEVSMRIDGIEKLRWNFGSQYPRPFFYPFNGPSGQSLTRMGHPGAQNHDHHRSVWFAHHKVNGKNFWADGTGTQIRQLHWYRYRDGRDEAIMASLLSWVDEEGVELMRQDVVAALMPIDSAIPSEPNDHAVEFQLQFRPGSNRDKVTLEQTNFGFLAVRVAASISGYFGGGVLTNDDGTQREANLHEKQSRWMDYSGPVGVVEEKGRKVVTEGITYFDHPSNPTHPTYWHVREDGWMGAAPGMKTEFEITNERPLTVRYLLHAHNGDLDLKRAKSMFDEFSNRPGFIIRKPNRNEPHRQYQVERAK